MEAPRVNEAVVIIGSELWSQFAMWVDGQGLALVDLSKDEGESEDFYRLERVESKNGFPEPGQPHVPARWS